MGEHRTVDELVARVTNQSIEIERMRGEIRSLRAERDHWVEVAADLRGKLDNARSQLVPPLVAKTRHELEALGFQFEERAEKIEPVREGCVIVDPYERKPPRWSWWGRVMGGA